MARVGYAHRNFGWIDDAGGVGGNFTGGNITNNLFITNSNATISYQAGTTEITNTSIETTNITVEQIDNGGQPVDFPDGLKSPDIYYNNAYEYTANSGMTHHHDVIFKAGATSETLIKTNTLEPWNDSGITVDSNLTITGNLSVLGATTSVSSSNTQFADRYLTLNDGYSINAAISSGLIANRHPGTEYVLSGSFTGTTVATVAADGLSSGDIIQVAGSTSNDGLYEVLSHSANVLTIKSSPVEPFLISSFAAEAAAGSLRRVSLTGLEFSDSGNALRYINGLNTGTITKRAIAYDTSSPTFQGLTLTSISNDNALTKVLVVDNSGVVRERSAASLTGSLSFSNDNDLIIPNVETFPLASATPVSGSLLIRRDPVEQRYMSVYIGPFSINLTAPADYITITYGNANYHAAIINSSISFPILLKFGLIEECLLITDRTNFVYKIVRKDLSQFPTGVVDHANFNVAGQPIHTMLTYAKLT